MIVRMLLKSKNELLLSSYVLFHHKVFYNFLAIMYITKHLLDSVNRRLW